MMLRSVAQSIGWTLVATLVVGAGLAHGASSLPTASEGAREALALCNLADDATGDTHDDLLERGLARAEDAVADDESDAVAHFAVFCNLGKRLESNGLGFRVLGDLQHARHALERSLELAPDYPDAIAAKGALLARLPRLLGGDREEGARLLRRALALDPANPAIRVVLTEVAGDADDASPAR